LINRELIPLALALQKAQTRAAARAATQTAAFALLALPSNFA
jgi:hypothetical protein